MNAQPKKLRLLFVISSLEAGGAEKVMTFLSDEFARRSHSVKLLTWDDGSIPPFYPLGEAVEHIPLGIRNNSNNIIQAIFENFRRIGALRRIFRETHSDGILSFIDTTNVVTLLAARGLGIPVVVGERMDPHFFPKKRLWRLLRSLVYPWARHIVVQTTDAKYFFSKALQEKMTIIPNPVFPFKESSIQRVEKKIAALGRLEEAKGFDILLEAFALIRERYPDWKLTIAGKGPAREKLETLRDKLKLSPHVEFIGEISNPWKILASSSLFVMASRTEGFPNALCEAMSLGLPVIASDCSGCRALVQDELNGLLFTSGNAKALAARLDRLMGDPLLRDRLSKQGRDVIDRFDPTKIFQAWNRVMEESSGKNE